MCFDLMIINLEAYSKIAKWNAIDNPFKHHLLKIGAVLKTLSKALMKIIPKYTDLTSEYLQAKNTIIIK